MVLPYYILFSCYFFYHFCMFLYLFYSLSIFVMSYSTFTYFFPKVLYLFIFLGFLYIYFFFTYFSVEFFRIVFEQVLLFAFLSEINFFSNWGDIICMQGGVSNHVRPVYFVYLMQCSFLKYLCSLFSIFFLDILMVQVKT